MSIHKVVDIDFSTYRPQRAGVVPFVEFKDLRYYCFGIDSKTDELTDFGGTVNKRDKNGLFAGLREFKEESLKIFKKLNLTDLSNSDVVYNDNMMILFQPIVCNIYCKVDEFRKRVAFERNPEVKDIVWLTDIEIKQILKNKKYAGMIFYERVRQLLQFYFI